MQYTLQRIDTDQPTQSEILREVDEHKDTLRYVVVRQDADSVRDVLASVSTTCDPVDLVSLASYILKTRRGEERDRLVQRHLEQAIWAARD